MIHHLIESVGLKPEEIAFFTQRDAFGEAGFSGGIKALRKYGLKNEWKIVHGRYNRNTLAVENAVADLLMHSVTPKAVIIFGTYAPCAKFIRLAKENGLNAIYLTCSFVGSEQFLVEAGESGENTVILQAVPHYDLDLPITQKYHKAIRQMNPPIKPTFTSLEGYICTQILSKALQNCRPPFQREDVKNALESLGTFDIGFGTTSSFKFDRPPSLKKIMGNDYSTRKN
jgi:branched-chain amino acid transport system substrate-binding protein